MSYRYAYVFHQLQKYMYMYTVCMKTAIFSWLQNDGNRGFSKDQLKGKQLLPTFQPDALVVFRAKVKLGGKNCTT